MEYLFTQEIHDWESWGKVFASKEAFTKLIKHIYEKEGLDFERIEGRKQGTNAVFKAGEYIIKIYAPKESGMDTDSDYKTELFGLERARDLGVSIPRLIAGGTVEDKYIFRYLILEYIDGETIGDVEESLAQQQKIEIGRKLREITNRMNTETESFNNIDIVKREFGNKRWDIMPENFNKERRAYLQGLEICNEVYVHGDLNPDNVLLDEKKNVYIIDFADSHKAPREYEIPALVCELFCFEKAFMQGYFGDEEQEKIIENCFKGILIHQFGSDMIKNNLGDTSEIKSLSIMKEKLGEAIASGRQL